MALVTAGEEVRADAARVRSRRMLTWWRRWRTGIGAPSPTEPPRARFATSDAFRRHILASYPFTAEARVVLGRPRFFVADLARPLGGGAWYGPVANRIDLQGIQAEAAIHELAHAWADLTGFYPDRAHPDDPWPTRHPALRADVRAVALSDAPADDPIAALCREYEFGRPPDGAGALGELDYERFAGLASGCMGDLRRLPPPLRRWYRGLFDEPAEA